MPRPSGRAGRIHPLQGSDERREVASRLDRVDVLDRHAVSLHPGVDLPEPGVLATRTPLRDRNGDLDGEQWSQLRQPLDLLAARLRRALATREPHGELLAEAEDRVDRAAGLDPAERQIRPLGELFA